MERDFEQRLLHLLKRGSSSGKNKPKKPFTVCLEIKELHSTWILKVRRQQIIVNNQELIFRGVSVDHSIAFETYLDFVSAVESETESQMELVRKEMQEKSSVEYCGDITAIFDVLTLLSMPVNSPSSSSPHSGNINTNVTFSHDIKMNITTQDNFNNITSSRTNNTHTSTESTSAAATTTAGTVAPLKKTKCLQRGWLYKKRDVFSGWTHRFFRVYLGRIEYFVDETDVVPRGVIPLLGAYIVGSESDPVAAVVNGTPDHYQLMYVYCLRMCKCNFFNTLKYCLYVSISMDVS